jgi:hypothetical protein
VTRIVAAYRPCTAKTKGLKTVYQQHLWHIQAKGLHCSPLDLFDKDLIEQISKWHEEGERIVLLMDVNEHPTEGKLNRKLIVKNQDMY